GAGGKGAEPARGRPRAGGARLRESPGRAEGERRSGGGGGPTRSLPSLGACRKTAISSCIGYNRSMEKTRFKSFDIDQRLLLPPDLREWLPENHLCYFMQEVVEELDLSKIYASYEGGPGGRPAFDPRMMVGLLLYGYCVGVVSSRKLEKATHESVPFRVLAAGQHPDHDTIAAFRRRHL